MTEKWLWNHVNMKTGHITYTRPQTLDHHGSDPATQYRTNGSNWINLLSLDNLIVCMLKDERDRYLLLVRVAS